MEIHAVGTIIILYRETPEITKQSCLINLHFFFVVGSCVHFYQHLVVITEHILLYPTVVI